MSECLLNNINNKYELLCIHHTFMVVYGSLSQFTGFHLIVTDFLEIVLLLDVYFVSFYTDFTWTKMGHFTFSYFPKTSFILEMSIT